MIQLNDKDKAWIMKGIELDMTRLAMKKKLEQANYPEERIDAFLEYYDLKMYEKMELERNRLPEKIEEIKEDETKFKDSVRKYFSDNKKELSWKERREIKNFIKNVEKYSKVLQSAIINIRKEIDTLGKRDLTKDKIETELKHLKGDIIDRLMDSKEILEIEHPETGEEITKENLKSLDIEVLINMMEENVDELMLVVNGKITE